MSCSKLGRTHACAQLDSCEWRVGAQCAHAAQLARAMGWHACTGRQLNLFMWASSPLPHSLIRPPNCKCWGCLVLKRIKEWHFAFLPDFFLSFMAKLSSKLFLCSSTFYSPLEKNSRVFSLRQVNSVYIYGYRNVRDRTARLVSFQPYSW